MNLVKNILVPTDYSENASAAFKYALAFAGEKNANVNALHVYIDYMQPAPLADTALIVDAKSIEQHENDIKNFVAEVSAGSSVTVSGEAVYGDPVDELIERSKKDYDLIVMGTTGERSFGEVMFGSTATSLAQNAHCPVLLVPNGTEYRKIDDILYACNFEYKQEKNIALIADLASFFGAKVHLLFVKTDDTDHESYTARMMKAKMEFEKDAPHVSFVGDIIEDLDVVDAINTYGKANNIDLVAVISKRRGFWGRLFHPSVTKEIAMYSALPVLIIKRDDI